MLAGGRDFQIFAKYWPKILVILVILENIFLSNML